MGRRVFITGVGRGLGRELARRWAARGDIVWGSTRTGVCDLGGDATPAGCVAIDLSDEASVTSGVADLRARTDAIDLLVNCAGLDARSFGLAKDHSGVFDVDAATFNAVLSVNVTGPMALTREALPLLRAGTDPMILNISSQLASMQVAGRKGRDATYCVSKAALNMLSVKTAAALRPEGIGVVMMHPGWVQTDMGGAAAPLTVDESVTAIVKTVDQLDFGDTGRFIRWDGGDHPW